jgi:succinate dehydrogenase/fumarate reductase flavoprotein subunit
MPESLPKSDDSLSCELLVVGAGMACMTAAGRAAEIDTKVIVIEKASLDRRIGLSLGYLWTATSVEQLSYRDALLTNWNYQSTMPM